jgi:arrestin-related trafficking adapter 4/5/7
MPHTMGDSSSSHLDIQLESSELVLRGFTGEELEPAVLKGELVLNLSEATNLKEIQLIFTGT